MTRKNHLELLPEDVTALTAAAQAAMPLSYGVEIERRRLKVVSDPTIINFRQMRESAQRASIALS